MWRQTIVYISASVLALLAGWGLYLEPRGLSLVRQELPLPGWTAELDGLEVVLLSDLHVGSPYYGLDKLEELVRRVNAQKPDLILLAGDYVIQGVRGGTFVSPEDIAPILGRLHARLGVFAVLGNHDWWLDGARVRRAFASAGVAVLEDEAVRLAGFWVVGIGDLWEAPHDIDKALAAVDDDAPVLAFTHNPDLFPEVPPRVTLTLAGHTHGGQVRLPILGTLVVPSRYGARFARGHIVEDERHLFVTSGLGTSIIPVRFRVPPEIAHLTLRAPSGR